MGRSFRLMKVGEPEYRCVKCGHEIRWEHDGPDYEIKPCPTCLEAAFDKGWNECYKFNIGKGGVLWHHIKDRIRNSTPWVVVGYGAGLLFCLACWYAVFVMLAPLF